MAAVCFVVQHYYDEDNRVRRKAEALVTAGYQVDVLALRSRSGKKDYSLKGVNVHTIDLRKRRGSLWRYLIEYVVFFGWTFVNLSLRMPRRRYVVIDVNSLPDFLVFAAAPAKWMGAKLILDLHEVAPEFFMFKFDASADDWLVRLVKFLEAISVRFADHVLTVNRPIEDLLVNRGLPRAKSTVIMNAADEERFSGDMGRGTPPAPDKVVLMYHGTLTELYALNVAIEAFALAKKDVPNAEFWILGSGSEESALRELVQARDLGSQVKLVGRIDAAEIPAWLSRCNVGLISLRGVGYSDLAFPNKLPEFIIAGKPALVPRLQAIHAYFSEEALAYYEPSNPADLARQFVRLYRDPALRARQAEIAREQYAPIRWPIMRQRYLAVVARLTGDQVPPEAAPQGPVKGE
jgi:glycosyltransferase involved in cell wall biosynthesis